MGNAGDTGLGGVAAHRQGEPIDFAITQSIIDYPNEGNKSQIKYDGIVKNGNMTIFDNPFGSKNEAFRVAFGNF